MHILYGLIFWFTIILMIYFINPKSAINRIEISKINTKYKTVGLVFIIYLIVACLLPMDLSPSYNGSKETQRNQYEQTAQAFKEGHLYLNYDVSQELLAMENPYDRQARDDQNVAFHFDTAFYNGHYYMYFGVTPVFLVYLPYLLLTGHALVGYKGTQIIVTVLIIGLFLLFKKLSDLFFRNISYGRYLFVSATMSLITVWYVISAPSLYTVPGVCGICMEVYSFLFFIKAVWDKCSENRSIVYAVIGALFGALTFGCRPTIAFANIFAIPLLIIYFKNRGLNLRIILKLIFVVLPYMVIGTLLMMYNYARFENPFEFGQSYQLTTEDQSQYMNMFSRFSLHDEIHGLIDYFVISSSQLTPLELGAFISFPILLFIFAAVFNKKVLSAMNNNKIVAPVIVLLIASLITASMDILWSPYFWARYRMDIYWMLGIAAFIVIGHYLQEYSNNTKLIAIIGALCGVSIALCFIMCIYPFDHNFTWDYKMTVSDVILDLVLFWK